MALSRSFLAGLSLSNNATDLNNDIDIGAGECRDKADTADLLLGAVLTKQLDAAWASGNNQGGLDTGTKAGNTWYHIHLIKRTDSGCVDALFSTSATSPALPSNYTKSRRIGSIRTDGSANIRAFVQDDDYFRLKAAVLDVDVTNPGTTAVLRTLTVPTGINVFAIINVRNNAGAVGVDGELYISDPEVNDEAPSQSAAPLATIGEGGSQRDYAQVVIRTNTSGQIRTRRLASDGNSTIHIATLGWYDRRGRGD